jgi:acyl-CoA-binding protein
MAMLGSISQPRRCVEEQKKWDAWQKLGGESFEENNYEQI